MVKSSIIINKEKYNSFFDKKLKDYIIFHLKIILLGVITLGLAYPWIICMKNEARCKHTVICGKRLKFIGKPKGLINYWILWWFLTIIILGFYGLVVKLRFERWTIANTIFEDQYL